MACADFGVAFGVQGVVDLASGAPGLTGDEEAHFLICVVDEGVREPCASTEADAVAGGKAADVAVDPKVRFALDHIDEFLLVSLRMWPGHAPSGQNALMMNAYAHKSEMFREGRAEAHQFVIAGIMPFIFLLEFRMVDYDILKEVCGAGHERILGVEKAENKSDLRLRQLEYNA
jgi:hypothetical protein